MNRTVRTIVDHVGGAGIGIALVALFADPERALTVRHLMAWAFGLVMLCSLLHLLFDRLEDSNA